MKTRVTVCLTILALLNLGIGCTKMTTVSIGENPNVQKISRQSYDSQKGIRSLILNSGQTIVFAKPGGRVDPNSGLVVGVTAKTNWSKEGENIELKLDQVRSLRFEKLSSINTAIGIILGMALVSTLALIAYANDL